MGAAPVIAAVVAVVGGVSRWWPRRGSGTMVAIALGAAGSVIAPGAASWSSAF